MGSGLLDIDHQRWTIRRRPSLEQIRAFLAGTGEVRLSGQRREEVYAWTERTLLRRVRRYVARMTGLSRAQVTRLIASYAESGEVKAAAYRRRKFPTRYSKADVELLAYVTGVTEI